MIRVIKKLGRILNRQQKGYIAVLFFMMVIAAAFNVLGVGMMLPLISALMNTDILTESVFASEVARIFGIQTSMGFVILCVVVLIIIFVAKDVYSIFESFIQNRFIYNTRFHTQSKILSKYMSKPYEFFLYASSGEIVRVIQSDIPTVFSLMSTMLYFFSELIISIALVIAVFIISPIMTAIVGIVMLATVLVIIKLVKPMLRRAGNTANKHVANMNKWLLQAMQGIKEIKVAGTEKYFQKQFDKSGKEAVEAARKEGTWFTVPQLLLEMTTICTALIAVVIQVYNGLEISATIAQLSAFVMAASRLMPSANRIINASNAVAYQEPALDNVLAVLEGKNEKLSFAEKAVLAPHEDSSDEVSLTANDKVELKDIAFSYQGSDAKVLYDASMEIPIGKSVGIVGTSGAGKTTAVDILIGLLVPQNGQVFSDGTDVRRNIKGWLSHISYIPQTIFMLDGTIRENVIFGTEVFGENDIEERVWHSLEEAKLADFVRTLPKGLDTEVGERGIRLSGGQRQRIGIARALFSKPEILIFDEATSSLDNETESAIMESINALHGRKTMIIIAHRLTTIEGCDIVYRVKDKKIERER